MIPFITKDIYFLIVLSRWGTPISLSGFTRGDELVRDYICQFFQEGSQPSRDGKINIRDVSDIPLRIIFFNLAKLADSANLHLANIYYMQYDLECLEPKVFNWCEVVLPSKREKMTKVKIGKIFFFWLWVYPDFLCLAENPSHVATTRFTGSSWT